MNTNKANHPLLLIIAGVLLALAILESLFGNKNLDFVFFILAGICQGFYYGFNNYRIFHFPHTNDYYKKLKFDSKEVTKNSDSTETVKIVQNSYIGVPELNDVARANAIWVHFLCSMSGAFAFHFLFMRIHYSRYFDAFILKHLTASDAVLFIIGILSYAGLLPMTLWFFAQSGKLLENMLRK